MSCTFTRYYSGDKFKECEIGGACGIYGGGIKCMWGFGGEN
jgi:hypothetical protein